jgi:hypothetical protein
MVPIDPGHRTGESRCAAGPPLTSGSFAGPGRVHCTQAIEQMLNARYWPRLFFREQDPKPISYFLTDCGVVV